MQTTLTADGTRRIIKTAEWDVEINEAGQGYPLFLLHGSGPGATGWTNFAPNLIPLAEKFRVIALTFPGWGRSGEHVPDKEPQRKSNARAIKLVMDALNIEQAALVGNSMGGVAVEQFTVDYPDRISHFVTMGSAAPGVNVLAPAGLTEGIRILTETYRNPTPENFRRLVRIMVYDDSFVTDELCELRAKAALANPKHLENFLHPKRDGTAGGDDVATGLARTTVPALIIHGRDDRTVLLENSLRLNALIPNSRLVVFNRCAHWAQVEHAAEFNALLEAFVSRNR